MKIAFRPFLLLGLFALDCFLSPQLPAEEIQAPVTQQNSKVEETQAPVAQQNSQPVITFTPPTGWKQVDAKNLSPNVKVMVIGKGEKDFPPSINLATEPYSQSLNDYLKRVKEVNQADGAEWKNLGSIKTKAGEGNLSQVDVPSEWGDIRMMHVILLKDNVIYILTAAALKNEFPKYYKDFFTSLQTLQFVQNNEKSN